MKEEKLTVHIKLLSPLHLGSGKADVNVDAEVVTDELGLPYFLAKRFKGILYESAIEVAEMSELCGSGIVTRAEVDQIFGHKSDDSAFVIQNFMIADYEQVASDLRRLEEQFPEVVTPQDVLEEYTSLRYQTEIDDETGTAVNGSLHNMRVVDTDEEFVGMITILADDDKTNNRIKEILALALRNISGCGLKRTRGFGRIECKLENGSQWLTLALERGGKSQ